MIVYHITDEDGITAARANGIKRSAGRTYVFREWHPVQEWLQRLSDVDPAAFGRTFVLVLDVGDDVLLMSPIPASQCPRGLAPDRLAHIQASTAYFETDIDPARIEGVKNALGQDIRGTAGGDGDRKSNILRFLAYVVPYWPWVAAATAAGVVKFLVPLSFPWMLRVAIDDVVYNPALTRADQSSQLMWLALLVIGLNIVWLGATWVRGMFTAVAGHRMIRDVRSALFEHLQRLSHHFFAVNQSGAIVARVVGDISQAQNLVGSALTNVWMDIVLMVVLLAILIPMHPMLTAVALALVPVFLLAIRTLGGHIRLSSVEVQQRSEVLSGGLQEKISGFSVVKSFTRETQEMSSFRSQADKLYSKVLQSVRFATWNEMAVGFVVMTAPVLVVWYGGHLIMAGELSVGQLTQFLLYLAMFYAPLQRMSDLGRVLASSLASIDRVFEYMDLQPQVAESGHPVRLDRVDGRIEFDQVRFGYDGAKTILHDVDLSVAPGETLALVGPSGSGKSTIANLIPRFYDPVAGVIRLDGHDLRDLSLTSLRAGIGIVPQETVLFSGTIRENLLLAKADASADDLDAALVAANARDFVEDLPEGLWTEIGERGLKLSGGQRQRLALARAFLKDPAILILDEATSALDSRSERLIQQALERLLVGRTSVVIAHRLSTIKSADTIATMENGRVVAQGSHAALIEQGGLYAQLYHEQFGQSSAAGA